MLYGHSSTERRTLSGFSAYRDPVEDSAWAQAFLNDFEAVEDEDGQRQVLTDYGHELTDPVRQDALRENLVGRLHRRAEIEKMDAREYMDRLSVLDSAPFGSKAHRQRRPGEYRVANAALLLGLMGSAGIAGAPLWAPVPGRIPGSLGRMTPPPVFGPYPGFPRTNRSSRILSFCRYPIVGNRRFIPAERAVRTRLMTRTERSRRTRATNFEILSGSASRRLTVQVSS